MPAVLAMLRSISPLAVGASQPSPSSARVPISTFVSPVVKKSVTARTHSRLLHAPDGPTSSEMPSLSGSPTTRSMSVRSRSRSSTSGAAATVLPVTITGDSAAVVGSASSEASASRAEPARSASTPLRSMPTVAAAASWSQITSIASRSPRLRCSAEMISTIARDFDSLRASTRSTLERPLRIPRLVSW